jgi:hypothetical protein
MGVGAGRRRGDGGGTPRDRAVVAADGGRRPGPRPPAPAARLRPRRARRPPRGLAAVRLHRRAAALPERLRDGRRARDGRRRRHGADPVDRGPPARAPSRRPHRLRGGDAVDRGQRWDQRHRHRAGHRPRRADLLGRALPLRAARMVVLGRADPRSGHRRGAARPPGGGGRCRAAGPAAAPARPRAPRGAAGRRAGARAEPAPRRDPRAAGAAPRRAHGRGADAAPLRRPRQPGVGAR